MEEITQEQTDEMIRQSREEIRQIIEHGGKITDTVIHEKNTVTTIRKVELANGENTSSTKIIVTLDGIEISSY